MTRNGSNSDVSRRKMIYRQCLFSVETCWSPLTPEHGFPSLLYKTQGAPPRPSRTYRECRITSFQKNKRHPTGCLRKNSHINTAYGSYGGIIRIRYVGRRSYLPLSLSYKLPLLIMIIRQFFRKSKENIVKQR